MRLASQAVPMHLCLDGLSTKTLERLEVIVRTLDAGNPVEELSTDDLCVLASIRIVDVPAEEYRRGVIV